MVALLVAEEGENCEAIKIISSIIDDYERADKKISDQELDFMRFFINKKIKELKTQNFDPSECYQKKY